MVITSPRHAMEWTMMNPPMSCSIHKFRLNEKYITDSISVGTVTNGYIVNPVKLPLSGKDYRIMDQQAQRGTNFGTREMVNLVKSTAQKVAAKYPGSIMHVANMAACGGGEIPWSVSHRSGRDVDIAFYMQGSDGSQIEPSEMINIGPDMTGKTRDGRQVIFDTARNWTMIRAIILDPDVSVQWIFIANHLKRRLLTFARKHKESKEIIYKASQVMWQPYRSSAHDDHIHVRIYCPVDDLSWGCRDIGSNRPWYVDHTDLIEKRVIKLARILRKPGDLANKKQVIEILGAIGTNSAQKIIAKILGSRNVSIRRAVAKAFFRWGVSSKDVAEGLPDVLNKETDGLTALYLLYAMKRYRGSGRCALICRILGIHREWVVPAGTGQWRFSAMDFAARVLALRGEVKAIALLIQGLDTANVMDRRVILAALRRITNRTLVFNAMDVDPHILQQAWSDWYDLHPKESRLSLLVSGFTINGVLSYESANKMSFDAKDYIRLYNYALNDAHPYNAMFLLSRLTKTWLWLPRNSMHSKFYYFKQRFMQKTEDLGIAPKKRAGDSNVKGGG